MTPAGLPHSEILGSKPVCGSPRLIAAYRVLHRLSAPRHPPCTLSSLTNANLLSISLPGESYRFLPNSVVNEPWISGIHACFAIFMVELIGFEPTTSALQGRRSPN